MTEEAAKRTICQLLELSDTLENIILKENELLDKRRPRELTRFRKDKEQIGWEYHSIMSNLKSDPSALANANPSDIATLKSVTVKLHALLNENYRRVVAAKTVTERLFKTIRDEIAERRHPCASYTSKATLAASGAYARTSAVPVAINEIV